MSGGIRYPSDSKTMEVKYAEDQVNTDTEFWHWFKTRYRFGVQDATKPINSFEEELSRVRRRRTCLWFLKKNSYETLKKNEYAYAQCKDALEVDRRMDVNGTLDPWDVDWTQRQSDVIAGDFLWEPYKIWGLRKYMRQQGRECVLKNKTSARENCLYLSLAIRNYLEYLHRIRKIKYLNKVPLRYEDYDEYMAQRTKE